MNVIYRLQGIEFEWDGAKAKSNVEVYTERTSRTRIISARPATRALKKAV